MLLLSHVAPVGTPWTPGLPMRMVSRRLRTTPTSTRLSSMSPIAIVRWRRTVLPQKAATFLRLALALGTVKWEPPLDECAAMHNNTNMMCAPLARVLPITANLARSEGATG